MTDPKNAARELSGRLAAREIAVKHVQALDLVAAGCGFQDRSKLSAIAELPKLRSVNARLLSTAATALALHDADRRRTIVDVTTDVLLGRAAGGIDLTPLTDALTRIKGGVSADAAATPATPSLAEWTANLMDLVEGLPKTRGGRPDFGFAGTTVAEWSSPFARYVLQHAKADDATHPLTALVDATLAVMEEEDGDQLGFSPEEDDVADGEKPIDYDRVAAILEPVLLRDPPMGPLEIALRDGAGRASPYAASLSDDPDTLGGAVRAWLGRVDETFRFGALPDDGAMRDLLEEGGQVVSSISHWLPAEDRLRAWMDVADHPGILGSDIDPEGSGVSGRWVEACGSTFYMIAADLSGPAGYLASSRSAKLIDALVEDSGFSAWSNDGRPLDDGVADGLASKAFEKIRAANGADGRRDAARDALVSAFPPSEADDDWYRHGSENGSRIVDALDEAAQALGVDLDRDEWDGALMDAYVARLQQRDDSEPLDALPPRERAEVLFFLHAPEDTIDEMCTIAGPWPEAKSVVMDDQFVFAMSRLGIAPEEWREATGSEMPDRTTRPAPAPLERLLTAEKLAEMVDNGCTQNFCVVLYGLVDVKDVLSIDLGRPFALTNASVAIYNQYAGTFHDERLKRAVVLQDGVDGSWQGNDVGYSPKDICGLAEDCYHARLYEPEAAARAAAATAALDASLAVEGLRRNQPGIPVSWTSSEDGFVLEGSAGTFDAARGYALRRFTATFDGPDAEIPGIEIHR